MKSAQPFASAAVGLLMSLHPLDRVPRSGFLLRGVAEPESIAAHSHALALLCLLCAPRCDPPADALSAVRMALIHDLAESKTMDIPLTVKDPAFRAAKVSVENAVFSDLFHGQEKAWEDAFLSFQEGRSAEARLVKGLDKVQMMIKVLSYQREGRGNLEDFWGNPENFKDYGHAVVREMFNEVLRISGRKMPAA